MKATEYLRRGVLTFELLEEREIPKRSESSWFIKWEIFVRANASVDFVMMI